ncbi:Zinc finger CCHC domain-containing protein 12 [Bienertia sinuspersici]
MNEDFEPATAQSEFGSEDDDSQDSDFYDHDVDNLDDDTNSNIDDDDDAAEMEDDGMMVSDNFDPYQGPEWDDDCEDMDNYLAKLYKNGEVYKEEEFGKIEIKPWQIFTEKQHLRDTMRDYCIQNRFSIVVQKANNKIYTVLCSDQRCPWRLHGSVLADGVSWAIKSITGDHTCLGLQTRNPMVSAKWAQRVLLEDIRAHNDIPGKALNKLLFERYGVTLPKSTIHRMKSEALVEIHGGFDVSYSYLPRYCEVVRQTNPTSSAHCIWNSAQHPERPLGFSSIFISFRACLDGLFAGCRGLIGVDGTFLKGNYGGVLLSAMALDGNNEMFPVSWAIVLAEDDECWRFFIYHLKSVLVSSDRGDNWCIISDRHKSIDKACNEIWPTVDRRYCCKHLSVNFKGVFPRPKMWQLFWLAANATSDFIFGKAMKQMEKVKAGARVWLSHLGEQSRWSKHQFNPAFKCDVNNTNFVESFNATLGTDRARPVMTLLEGIRRVSMVRMAIRRESCEKWDRQDICPNIVKRWPETQAPEIGPPAFRRGVGRPTKNRKRGEEEQRKGKRSKTIKCGICGQFGHNKLTCQRAPTRKQKKGKEKKAEGAATTSKKGKKKAQ